MPNSRTIVPEQAKGLRSFFFRWVRGHYGGIVPGVFQVLAVDLGVARPAGALYRHLHLQKSSSLSRLQREMLATLVNGKAGGAPWLGLRTAAVRRLTGDEHLSHDLATTWPEYELDSKTRSLLGHASKLTALISFFNFSGRLEATSGLPPDQIPEGTMFAEARQSWDL